MLRIGVLRAKNGGRRPPLSRQGYRICVASISAVIPGAAQHEVVRCRPGTQVPRHQKKGTAGVLGSRLSLRSAGMTTEETAPYAVAPPLPGRIEDCDRLRALASGRALLPWLSICSGRRGTTEPKRTPDHGRHS